MVDKYPVPRDIEWGRGRSDLEKRLFACVSQSACEYNAED